MKVKIKHLLAVCFVTAFALPAAAQFAPGQVLTAGQLNAEFANVLPLAGGTLTGPLTVPTLTATTALNTAHANITGGTIIGLSSPLGFTSGGTSTTSALGVTSAIQFQAAGSGATARPVSSKLNDLISVQDFLPSGFVAGGDCTSAFTNAAAAATPGNSQVIGRPNIPSPSWTNVYVGPINCTLSSEVPVANNALNWLMDPGAVINNPQYLNGRVNRLGSKLVAFHTGITDNATTLSISSNRSQDPQAQVSGFTDPSQLSAGNGRDSVSTYIENRLPGSLYSSASVAAYSSTGATLSTPLTTAQLAQMRTGMIVTTQHTPQPYAGMVTAWTPSSITVSSWYLVNGASSGSPTTPTGTTGLDVNTFRKAWAVNGNVFIDTGSWGNAVNTVEWGLQNLKGEAQSRGGAIEANGVYMTNLAGTGSYYGDAAYIADGAWTWGYKVNGGVTNPFYYDGSTNAGGDPLNAVLTAKNAAGQSFLTIGKSDGSSEIGLRGTGTATPTYIDFHSGAADADYDVRLQSTGGTGAVGGGTLTASASSILLNATTNIDAGTVLRPAVDGASGLGQAARRFSSGYIITLNATNVNTANLTLTGPIQLPAPITVTGTTYTQTTTDSSLIFNGSANQTVTLLAPATYCGRMLKVKNVAAFTLSSASSNVVPLAGGSPGTAILAAGPGKFATLQSDCTNWIVMESN